MLIVLLKALITVDIIDKIYVVGKAATDRSTEAARLEDDLQSWTTELPGDLSLNTQETISAAPPHILSLHLQRECAMIALQYQL